MPDIPKKIYPEKPKGNIHWDLIHSRYRIIPELQDAVTEMFYRIPEDYQQKLLDQYHKDHISLIIHFLPIETLVVIEDELFNYFKLIK